MADGSVGDDGRSLVPAGLVTFLFTDVESSTRLWADDRDAMSASLVVHDELLRHAFESGGGYVFTTAGDSFAVAFSRASEAVDAALAVQARLAGLSWPGPRLRVRMGLHLGEADERGGDYFGPVVNLTARLESAAHGGQVLVTDAVRQAAGIEAKDLGVHQLRDVAEPMRIWQLGDTEFPPLRVVDSGLTNLPSSATGLVGRASDLGRVTEALRSSRLVTLTAGGGTGKTRLALAVGEQVLSGRADGVWFVDLTAVSDPVMVPAAIAAALGLSPSSGDVTEQVLDYVAGKDLLVIVDNCEHLIDECAEFGDRFLARSGVSSMLATSRERLDVDGEQVVAVPPLEFHDAHSSAVDLFVERARARDASFVVRDDDRGVIAQLCGRLDGVPLAIELAASRSGVMTPAELLAGIEDRFQLLQGGRRRRQPQRSLEAALDWSYDLLTDLEQRSLRALSVFAGTFDVEAIAAVTGLSSAQAVDVLDSLIAKSLVVRRDAVTRSRFRLFETTALYAQQRLADAGETADIRDKHLAHYMDRSQRYAPAMWADHAAGSALGSDKANITAAFDWAATHDDWVTAARMLLGAFAVYHRHPVEGGELVERCVEVLPEDHHDLAMRLESNRVLLYLVLTDHGPALAGTLRRLRQSPTPLHQVHGLAASGFFMGLANRVDDARALLAKAEQICNSLPEGPDAIQAAAAVEVGASIVLLQQMRPEEALQRAQEALRLHANLGFDSELSASGAGCAAAAALMMDDPHTALAIAERHSRPEAALATGGGIGALAYALGGELEKARDAAKAYAHVGATGRVPKQATDCVLVLAALDAAEGDHQTARDLMLNMGLCGQLGLAAYARHLATRLGIGVADYDQHQAKIYDDPDENRRRSIDDITILQGEMTKRGWT